MQQQLFSKENNMKISFFKELDFKRFFEEMKKKQSSYGEIRGRIILKDIKKWNLFGVCNKKMVKF